MTACAFQGDTKVLLCIFFSERSLLLVAVFDRLAELIPANIYIAKDNPTDQWVGSGAV